MFDKLCSALLYFLAFEEQSLFLANIDFCKAYGVHIIFGLKLHR
jgi:hypothetical protein